MVKPEIAIDALNAIDWIPFDAKSDAFLIQQLRARLFFNWTESFW